MMEALSYFFSLFILILIFYAISTPNTALGIDKKKYSINAAWIILFVFYGAYMSSYLGYNFILDISIIGLYLLFFVGTKNNVPLSKSYMKFYLLFLIWSIISLYFTQSIEKGILMFVKLILPLFLYMFAYRAINNALSVWVLFDRISKLSVLYFLFSLISIPILDYFEIYPYFGLAIFPCAFVMWQKTGKKRYLIFCLLCLSNNVVEIKRTPMLGMILMMMVFFVFKYKVKAVIPSIVAIVAFILSILYVPALRNRMFFEGFDPQGMDVEMVLSEETLSLLNSNGRFNMWNTVKENFYEGHELTGSGLGTVKGWLVSPKNTTGHFKLLHNDWLHLLCETGLIGIVLLILFFVALLKSTYSTYNGKYSYETKLVALALAMVSVGTMCHMYFENCIGGFGFYLPFVFTAIFLRYKDIEKADKYLLKQ